MESSNNAFYKRSNNLLILKRIALYDFITTSLYYTKNRDLLIKNDHNYVHKFFI